MENNKPWNPADPVSWDGSQTELAEIAPIEVAHQEDVAATIQGDGEENLRPHPKRRKAILLSALSALAIAAAAIVAFVFIGGSGPTTVLPPPLPSVSPSTATPSPTPTPSETEPEISAVKETLLIEFDPLSSEVSAEGERAIKELAKKVANNGSRLVVSGYVDADGNKENDATLSRERAESVAKLLIANGASSPFVFGQGRTKAILDSANKTAFDAAQITHNRVAFVSTIVEDVSGGN